jgi:hypothetical protein
MTSFLSASSNASVLACLSSAFQAIDSERQLFVCDVCCSLRFLTPTRHGSLFWPGIEFGVDVEL